ncbi:unnamed protein product, partial [Ectocarpus sp. 13 AM-2016]
SCVPLVGDQQRRQRGPGLVDQICWPGPFVGGSGDAGLPACGVPTAVEKNRG